MVNVFESLLTAENLVDVTIAVEGKFLKAHKIVLSACSPYFQVSQELVIYLILGMLILKVIQFQTMFVNHSPSDRYPILLFHDIKFAHLKTLLDFMYRGEISIDEKDLGDVLKVAEALSIRGLSSFESDDEEGEGQGTKPEGGGGQNQGQGPGSQGQGPGPGGEENSVTTSSTEFEAAASSSKAGGAPATNGSHPGKSGTVHKPKGKYLR